MSTYIDSDRCVRRLQLQVLEVHRVGELGEVMRIDRKVRSQAADLEDRVGRDSGQTEVDMELDRVLRVPGVSPARSLRYCDVGTYTR